MEGSSDIMKLGPFGDVRQGKAWDEKGHSNIVQIFISHHHNDSIDSFQYQYADENGKLVVSELHGKIYSNNFEVVTLNYPDEYITWIKGYTGSPYGYYNSSSLVSITIGTNVGEYGPFGRIISDSKGCPFSVKLGKKRQFFGFHGTASDTIRSIGVYMKPNPDLHMVTDVKTDK